MKLDKVKSGKKSKIAGGKNIYKKIAAALISVVVFLVSFVLISAASTAARDTVAVLRVTVEGGILKDDVFSKNNIEKYDIIRKEYTGDMVLAENMDDVIDKFATRHIRKGAMIHEDEIIDEEPSEDSWISDLDDGQEILTIEINHLRSGGNLLSIGGWIQLHVIYEGDASSGNRSDNPNENYGNDRAKNTQVEVLFSIEVKDMQNSNGESIYKIYKDTERLPENQRQELIKSADFIKRTVPKALVLVVDSDQAAEYYKYKYASNTKAFEVTILK